MFSCWLLGGSVLHPFPYGLSSFHSVSPKLRQQVVCSVNTRQTGIRKAEKKGVVTGYMGDSSVNIFFLDFVGGWVGKWVSGWVGGLVGRPTGRPVGSRSVGRSVCRSVGRSGSCFAAVHMSSKLTFL